MKTPRGDILFTADTPLGFQVRVTRMYWHSIVAEKHPAMRGRLQAVLGSGDSDVAYHRDCGIDSTDRPAYIASNAVIAYSKGSAMATITIRNLDDDLKTRLRVRASSHDHSMEEEARIILKEALRQEEPQAGAGGLGTRIRRRFADIGAEELPLPHRDEPARKPDNFT